MKNVKVESYIIMKKFGHYEVTQELGRGGMGVVYKGWEPSLNRQVAIKTLGEHLLSDKDLIERFTREAKATAALNNPNVIQIYFIGKEAEQPYFAMEFIEGKSLEEIINQGSSLSVSHAKNLVKQACNGLAAAHKKDLVHRDIKPANLMLTKDGILKIVDFGIARTREYGDKLTNTGEFVGTPGYLSPEVCIGQEVDQRSDIFSLGIVFYQMLAGKVPFENESPLGLMLDVVQSDIPNIRSINSKVDKKTAFILNKMIAKSPEERYQNCDEIIRDIGNVCENVSIEKIINSFDEISNNKTHKINQHKITLATAETQNNKTIKVDEPKSFKWLYVAATLFVAMGVSGFAYINGYIQLPIGNSDSDNKEIVEQETTRKVPISKNTDKKPQAQSLLADETSISTLAPENNKAVSTPHTLNDKPPILASAVEDVSQSKNNEEIETPQLEIKTVQTEMNSAPIETAIKPTIKAADAIVSLTPDTMNTALPKPAKTLDHASSVAEKKVTKIRHKAEESLSQVSEQVIAHIATKATPKVKKNIIKTAPKKPKAVAVPLNKGVVVLAFGDPAIANPVEKIIESDLKRKGVKVLNEQFISGMRQLLDEGVDLAKIKSLVQKNGGQAIIIANVNYIGSQQLNYAGRTSELINAQLDIDSYDVKSGESIGEGFGSKISYTGLNATEQATDAVLEISSSLAKTLKKRI